MITSEEIKRLIPSATEIVITPMQSDVDEFCDNLKDAINATKQHSIQFD
jgi:hypothetical protein